METTGHYGAHCSDCDRTCEPGPGEGPDPSGPVQPALVSVIIPTYNCARFLAPAIESVLAQTYRPIEILVVDDGSTDDTPETVARYGPPVRYVRQANAGTAAARNTGVRHARGEFIALLDHDDLWLPHKLERQVPRFLRHPGIGLVFAGIEFFDTASGRVTAIYFPAETLDAHALLAHQVLPVQTMIFRRSALDRVGPFDTTLRGTDDWDMGIRMAAQFQVVGVAETLARVRLHETQQGRDAAQMHRQALRVLAKHAGLHPGCPACRRAVRISRGILHEDYYAHLKGRVFAAWAACQYLRAALLAAFAFWQFPPALGRVLGRYVRAAV